MDGGLHPLAFQVCMTDREGGVNMVVTYEALFLALAVGTLVYTISRNQNNDENRKKVVTPPSKVVVTTFPNNLEDK